MANFDAPWDDNYEFDPEVWLQLLLAVSNDKEEKKKMVERIVKKTGPPHEKAESIIVAVINFMANKARSN